MCSPAATNVTPITSPQRAVLTVTSSKSPAMPGWTQNKVPQANVSGGGMEVSGGGRRDREGTDFFNGS